MSMYIHIIYKKKLSGYIDKDVIFLMFEPVSGILKFLMSL